MIIIFLYKLKRIERYTNDSLRCGHISTITVLDHQTKCKSGTVSQPGVAETLVPNESITLVESHVLWKARQCQCSNTEIHNWVKMRL